MQTINIRFTTDHAREAAYAEIAKFVQDAQYTSGSITEPVRPRETPEQPQRPEPRFVKLVQPSSQNERWPGVCPDNDPAKRHKDRVVAIEKKVLERRRQKPEIATDFAFMVLWLYFKYLVLR